MEITIVYRIENSVGKGPYRGDSTEWETHDHANNYRKTPMPCSDGIEVIPAGWLFGCASLRGLFLWFNKKERLTLRELGFYVSVYTVTSEQVTTGGKQCLFNPDMVISRIKLNITNEFATISY